MEKSWPNFACIELTRKCPATCRYCFADSSLDMHDMVPRDKMLELIVQLQRMDYRQIYWEGGDPLLHPDLFEIVCYAREKGIGNCIFTSGLPITQKIAKKLCGLQQHKVINAVGIHLDTINQEVFSRLHRNAEELDLRIRGYRNLLEAGFPPERITPCITLTSASAETVEETIDWFHEQMAATRFLQLQVFNPLGRARRHPWLEPSLSQVRRAYEYRTRRYGVMDWLRIGSMDWGKHQCSSLLTLLCDGSVMPCGQLPREFAVGNFYHQGLDHIVREHRTVIARHDLVIKGKCADCKNNDICWGCRASAYHYLGDVEASDPKCWHNPAARETYLR